MTKVKGFAFILMGLFMMVVAVVMLVHDYNYIFRGETVNLNEIIESGADLPRDSYVTYSCSVPLGNYAESRNYISGVIPLSGKTQQYAFLAENGYVMSVELNNKQLIKGMDELIEAEEAGEPVSITGCLVINSTEMDGFLTEFFR